MSRRVLHVLTGPTAVGKTALALAWAQAHGAEIVSCDALCVYRGMDIGTAKPTAEERARVPHHGIDLVSAGAVYSVKAYQEAALEAVQAIERRGRAVLVVGGSGFYLKGFYAPVADAFEIPETVVREVAAIFDRAGLAGAVARLRELNPGGTGTLDLQNPRRVVRALERCLATGRTVDELKVSFEAKGTPFAGWKTSTVLLARSAESLAERARLRVRGMFEAGLVDEVRKLRESGLEANPSARTAIGYREVLAWLDEGARMEALLEVEAQVVANTLKLIAKQRKWFRTQLAPDRVLDLDATPSPDFGALFPEPR